MAADLMVLTEEHQTTLLFTGCLALIDAFNVMHSLADILEAREQV